MFRNGKVFFNKVTDLDEVSAKTADIVAEDAKIVVLKTVSFSKPGF